MTSVPVPSVFLATRRLVMRQFRYGDEADLVDLHRDSRVREYLIDDAVTTEEEAAKVIRWLVGRVYREQPGFGLWHASVREDGVFAGFFSLTPLEGGPDVELGARLHPRVWGRRLALEGAEALLRHGFVTLELERVVAQAHPDNRPVRFFLERLGFEQTGEGADVGVVRYLLCQQHWRDRVAARRMVLASKDTTTSVSRLSQD